MKLISFNPSDHSYAFRLNGYCYAVKNRSVCSLKLTEEEATLEYEKELSNNPNRNKEESVHYCRDLAKFLLSKNYYNDASKDPYPITIYENSCGHCTLADGQHRTCIAKHLEIKSIEVDYHINKNLICSVCSLREKKKRWYEKLSILKRKEIPRTIIDDEHLFK